MFILFGWRGVKLTKGTGQFVCPGCGRRADYEHKKVRRFFTLFFIPLIPLDQMGEYVLCLNCKGTYQARVIDPSFQQNMKSQLEEQNRVKELFFDAAKYVMYLTAWADGEIDDREVQVVSQTLQSLTGRVTDAQEVRRELAAFDWQGASLDKVRDAAGQINDRAKELLVKSASAVAGAKGQSDPKQRDLVEKVALALSTNHLLNIARTGGPPAMPTEPPPLPPVVQ